MQYTTLSFMALAAGVFATSFYSNGTKLAVSNGTDFVTLIQAPPADSVHPVPWPIPGFPEGEGSSISIPAEPTHPAAACNGAAPGEPHEPAGPAVGGVEGGIPNFDEPHTPHVPGQHRPPHVGPGLVPVPIPVNGATSTAHSMVALALGIAAAVAFSL